VLIGLWGATALVVGSAAGMVTGYGAAEMAALAGIAVGALIWTGRRWWLVAALGCAGVVYGAESRAQASPTLAELGLTDGSGLVRVHGVLASDAVASDAGVRLDLHIGSGRGRLTVVGALAPLQMSEWTRGRVVSVPARVREPALVRNPGSPSPMWQRLTRPFDVIGTVKSGALVEVSRGPWWAEASAAARRYVRATVADVLTFAPPSTPAIVNAIVIGDRSGLDQQLVEQFQVAGIVHVIAISGGNVAMLAVVCLAGLRVVSRSPVWPLVVTAGVVIAYGVVVGGEPSVVRAVLAASLYLVLRLVGLSPRPLNLLVVVAALSVLLSPTTVIDVGAWLSFGATWGLIVILPRLLRAADGPPDLAGIRLPVWLRTAVLATVAAELVILPVTVVVFSRVTLAGVALNLVAIPAMAAVQMAGLALCVFAPVSSMAARGAGYLADLAATTLRMSADGIELAPWLSWRVPDAGVWWVVAYYAALALWLVDRRRRRRNVWAAGAAVALAVLMTAPFVGMRRPQAGWLRVTILDVGQGDAILVQTPDRRSLLVDAGGTLSGRFDIGARIVSPAVWALGERRINWLVLSHGDIDHMGGAESVIDDLKPTEVWEGVPVEGHAALDRLRAQTEAAGMSWRRVFAGHEVDIGGVRLLVRHPPLPDWQRLRTRNDDSLVLDVSYGDVTFLLTGDAGAEFEATGEPRRRAGRRPRIRILKVAHHGSRSSTREDWLGRFSPQLAVISAGTDNLFGHPAPDVVGRLHHQGASVYRTDQHGAVIIETDGREARVRAVSGPRLQIR
jgi:competence protein ComEC